MYFLHAFYKIFMISEKKSIFIFLSEVVKKSIEIKISEKNVINSIPNQKIHFHRNTNLNYIIGFHL